MADPLIELPPSLIGPLRDCAAGAADTLPADYGDPDGLWVTVRRQNPFDVLLLDGRTEPPADAILVRFRLLWKFWNQKLTISRQGATRTAIRQKYGDNIESYIDNLQWAWDQLSANEGIAFWRKRVQEQRVQTLWARVHEIVEATLADGMLDTAEVTHLLSRAEYAGYEREEFAVALRDALHARRFEPEVAPAGTTESARLASVRWARSDVWTRIRAAARPKVVVPPVEQYYARIARTATVLGPVTAERMEQLIRANDITAADSVCTVGAPEWQPIAHSRFAAHFRQLVPVSPFVCPQCGGALVAVHPSSLAAWMILLIGVLTLFIFIGIVFVILGIVMLVDRKSKVWWRCTRCRYST